MKTILEKLSHPLIQVLLVFILFLVSNLIFKFFTAEPNFPWTLAIAFQLLFIIYNIILGLINKPKKWYWMYSLAGFVILMFVNSFMAKSLSGLSMDQAGTYRWIYFVLLPVFFLFIGITTLIRKIVALAEQEDRRFDKTKS